MNFFEKASDWLVTKAGVVTIDWKALAERGQDSVMNPAYMDQYMLPAFAKCRVVVESLDLERTTTAEAIIQYYEVKERLGGTADDLLKQVGNTVELLSPLAQVNLMLNSYRVIIWYMWAMALTSANMHVTAMMHNSGISDEDIAYHATLTTMMFNVITQLNSFGFLAPIKKRSTSGLGAAPLIAIALGAVAIIALAWAIVAIFEISQRNEVVKAACVEATKSGDPVAIANCQKIFSNPEGDVASIVPKTLGKLVENVAMVAMVGAGIYLAIQFGPGIATKVKQSVVAWKAG